MLAARVESSPLRLSKCRELRILPSARNAKIASDGYAAVTRSTDGFFERFLPIGSREHDRQWGPLGQKNPVRLHNEAASSEVARLSISPIRQASAKGHAFSITPDESRTTNASWALTARALRRPHRASSARAFALPTLEMGTIPAMPKGFPETLCSVRCINGRFTSL
jgi:hypothetical protein